MILNGQVILVTGGTGYFGRRFVERVLSEHTPRKVIVFSRDEYKQYQMRSEGFDDPRLRYFLGDVRDKDRLYRALDGVDLVVHTAALKQVPACEYNPIEAVKTNVMGAANLIEASIDRRVKRVIALSTDKAAAPVNLYGATKLCADKLFIAGNSYSGVHETRFSVVRYGNVMGSRGSVVPLYLKLRETGKLPVTDPRMTRFWITVDHGVRFVLKCAGIMEGGEVFVPKIPSMKIVDMARAVAPDCEIEHVGIRPGEKIHEVLIPEDDARTAVEYDDMFVVLPAFRPEVADKYYEKNGGKPCPDGFRYTSDANKDRLTPTDIREILGLDVSEDRYRQTGDVPEAASGQA